MDLQWYFQVILQKLNLVYNDEKSKLEQQEKWNMMNTHTINVSVYIKPRLNIWVLQFWLSIAHGENCKDEPYSYMAKIYAN